MTYHFISDLHLGPHQPRITELCLYYLQHQARDAQALYILGDLFEYWLGDDAIHPHYLPVIEALKQLSDQGCKIFFMHGNRDFLVGEGFCQQTGCQLLDDPTVLALQGEKVLLSHGDLLCTDDLPYQQFRAMVRDANWQRQFLSLPIEERRQQAEQARTMSQQATQEKAAAIMDVNQQTVVQTMKKYGVTQLIHGHTHRPNRHRFELDGKTAQRVVLSDWADQGHYLAFTAGEFTTHSFGI